MGKHFYGTASLKSEAMNLANYYAKHYKNAVCYTPSKESSCTFNPTTQKWTCMAAAHHWMGSCGRNEHDTQRGENIRRDRDRGDTGDTGGIHKSKIIEESEIEQEDDYVDASQEDYVEFENNTGTKKVSYFLQGLTPDEVKSIYEPISEEETTFSISFVFEEEETLEDETGKQTKSLAKVDAILHGTIKRTCYIAYAKYQYHAWVTLGNKPYAVDLISAKMNSGNGEFLKKVNNASSLKKLDEVYQTGNACRSARMTATARKGTAGGTVQVRL